MNYEWREELLSEETGKPENSHQCPTITLQLENITTRALIDSGSQISCVSEQFYDQNASILSRVPSLPVVGTSVIGATGGRPVKLRKQIYAEFNMGRLRSNGVFVIVPRLTKTCIIGVDILEPLEGIINFKHNELTVRNLEVEQIMSTSSEGPREELVEMCCMSKANVDKTDDEEFEDQLENKVSNIAGITRKERARYSELIRRYREIFRTKPGRISGYHHELHLRENAVYRKHSYPTPMQYEKQIDKEIRGMLEDDIIRRSNSPYTNPLVVTPKKDGRIRLCLDARRLNEILEDDYEGTESMEVLFIRCRGKRVFTRLDLNMSFWQIPLHPDSRKFTAFLYKGKCYEHVVTPFGLKTSTAALVRGLDTVLGDLGEFVIPYVDDILIASESDHAHLQHLETVLHRFEQHNVTLNIRKCEIKVTKVNFLGHILSPEGIQPDPLRIQAIKDFTTPKNKKQLQGFLGTVNFSAKFTDKVANKLVPLLELLRKEKKWIWEPKHQEAFENIKDLFGNWVMLHFPDPRKTFYLQTDASDYAIGVIVYQVDDTGCSLIIGCSSRTLKGAEITYCTTEKELLALVWSLQKYHNMLFGASIIHRTDHRALTFLKTCRLLSGRLMRWTLAIQDYNLRIEFCPGKENIVADALSRQTCPEMEPTEFKREQIVLYPLARRVSARLSRDMKDLKVKQEEDPKLKEVMRNLKEDKGNDSRHKLAEGILYRKGGNGWKVFLPLSMIRDLVQECHEVYNHIGSRKCLRMICEDFYHPGLHRKIKFLLRACDKCQRNKPATQSSLGVYQPILTSKPLDAAFVDFYGPLPASTFGYRYVLVILDGFTKYVKIYPLRKQTTRAAMIKIFTDYIPKFGKPTRVVTDHGTQFTSQLWKQKLSGEGIQHTLTSIRHPQANMVERVNREISKFLRLLLEDTKHSSWYGKLQIVEDLLNQTHHETTGFTPMELMVGKKPSRFWLRWIPKERVKEDMPLERKLVLVGERIHKIGQKRAQKFNNMRNVATYQTGELVMVKAYNISDKMLGRSAKFMAVFEGPYIVKKLIRDSTAVIVDPQTNMERGMFHFNDLKKYWTDTKKCGMRN